MDFHQHEAATRRPLHDARGIFCGYFCARCEREVTRSFRAEIFSNPAYYADEPIDED